MKTIGMRSGIAMAALLAGSAAAGWGMWVGPRLYYQGRLVSSGVIVRNGVAYVPIKDVASALSLTIQNRADGYAIGAAGGGSQIQGLNGKVGDDLYNGVLRLKVLEVVRGDSYKRRFSHGDDIMAPPGQDIVAVVMRVKNGTPKSLFPNVTGNPAALTDEDAHSYEPYSFPDGQGRNVDLLPGAATDFALIFNVPKTAVLKDLVYTADVAGPHGPAFRVTLK